MLLIVIVYPLGYAFWISLTDFYLPSPPPVFVGLKNYKSLILDHDFIHSPGITAVLTVGAVSIQMFLGFFVAFLLGMIVFRKISSSESTNGTK